MSQAFGWPVDRLEQHIVNLIQKGDIQARVDRQNKVRDLTWILRVLSLIIIV